VVVAATLEVAAAQEVAAKHLTQVETAKEVSHHLEKTLLWEAAALAAALKVKVPAKHSKVHSRHVSSEKHNRHKPVKTTRSNSEATAKLQESPASKLLGTLLGK
jgi:hypothetical protein